MSVRTRRALLGLAAAALLRAAPAAAWDFKIENVDARLQKAASRWTDAKGAPRAKNVLRSAKQGRPPSWTRDIADRFTQVHWSQSFQGKTYYFAVGQADGIKNPALLISVAQDRARAALVLMLGRVKMSETRTPDGGRTDATTAQGAVSGARALDWYAPKKDALDVLMAVVR